MAFSTPINLDILGVLEYPRKDFTINNSGIAQCLAARHCLANDKLTSVPLLKELLIKLLRLCFTLNKHTYSDSLPYLNWLLGVHHILRARTT